MIPYDTARRIAAAATKDRYEGSEVENCKAFGNRLGADQNGAPVLVVAFSGNVKVSCFTRFAK
jgi:hypothetical protein